MDWTLAGGIGIICLVIFAGGAWIKSGLNKLKNRDKAE